MSQRIALDARATTLMVVVCAAWGLQQIVLKAAAPDMTPVLQIALRSGMAAVLVGIFLRVKGLGLFPREALPAGAVVGVLFSLEYLLAGEGLRFTTASHMSVMLYTAPIFAALGLHFFIPEERLNRIQWIGIALAFIGVVVMFYNPSSGGDQALSDMLWGDFLGLLGGLAWGATTVAIRGSRLSEIPAAQTVFIQLVFAFVVLLAAAGLLGGYGFNSTPRLWGSLAYQVIIVSFITFLIWFWLLRVYLASRLGVLLFLTPVFGVIFGVVLLNDKVDIQFVAGTLCIMSGIILVSGWQLIRDTLKRLYRRR